MDPERHDKKQEIKKFDLTHVESHENRGKVAMRDQVEAQEYEEQEK